MPVLLCSALDFLFSEGMARVPLGCTDDSDFDKYVSKSIQNYGCHECDDVAFMLARLAQATSSVVIDIGGSIGAESNAAWGPTRHTVLMLTKWSHICLGTHQTHSPDADKVVSHLLGDPPDTQS